MMRSCQQHAPSSIRRSPGRRVSECPRRAGSASCACGACAPGADVRGTTALRRCSRAALPWPFGASACPVDQDKTSVSDSTSMASNSRASQFITAAQMKVTSLTSPVERRAECPSCGGGHTTRQLKHWNVLYFPRLFKIIDGRVAGHLGAADGLKTLSIHVCVCPHFGM